jgi:hypothetical protein
MNERASEVYKRKGSTVFGVHIQEWIHGLPSVEYAASRKACRHEERYRQNGSISYYEMWPLDWFSLVKH